MLEGDGRGGKARNKQCPNKPQMSNYWTFGVGEWALLLQSRAPLAAFTGLKHCYITQYNLGRDYKTVFIVLRDILLKQPETGKYAAVDSCFLYYKTCRLCYFSCNLKCCIKIDVIKEIKKISKTAAANLPMKLLPKVLSVLQL